MSCLVNGAARQYLPVTLPIECGSSNDAPLAAFLQTNQHGPTKTCSTAQHITSLLRTAPAFQVPPPEPTATGSRPHNIRQGSLHAPHLNQGPVESPSCSQLQPFCDNNCPFALQPRTSKTHPIITYTMSLPSRTATPSRDTGSHTLQETAPNPVLRLSAPSGVLRLRAEPEERRHIQWAEDVIDNEGMGKKSSKGTCTCPLLLTKAVPLESSARATADARVNSMLHIPCAPRSRRVK